MASIGPHIPAHLPARKEAGQDPPEAGPSIGPLVPPAQARPAVPVPRYEEEEEEEEEEEDEDVYVPELPPDLAAARANPSVSSSHARRPIGPALRGPLRREEEEEESEDEIGPAPLPPPPAGTASSHAHEDAVIEFMQKEAQRRQAIEVRFCCVLAVLPPPSRFPARVFFGAVLCCACTRVVSLYSPPPLLYRRRRAPRRLSVTSGCSSRPHLQIC